MAGPKGGSGLYGNTDMAAELTSRDWG